MSKDQLFVLPPGFEANDRREFCPECAEIWGVLSYYPAIRDSLEIHHVGIDHPRQPICDLLGAGNWNAPTLVLSEFVDGLPDLKESQGRHYLDSARSIAKYFAKKFGTAQPRGS